VAKYADLVADVLNHLQPDGFQVYDIQDEPSRSGQVRPFPFRPTHDPSEEILVLSNIILGRYAQLLAHRVSKGEPIVYKALTTEHTAEHLKEWIHEMTSFFGLYSLVLVGGTALQGQKVLSVTEAAKVPNRLIYLTKLDRSYGKSRHSSRRNYHP
jgi:hypothetical protein